MLNLGYWKSQMENWFLIFRYLYSCCWVWMWNWECLLVQKLWAFSPLTEFWWFSLCWTLWSCWCGCLFICSVWYWHLEGQDCVWYSLKTGQWKMYNVNMKCLHVSCRCYYWHPHGDSELEVIDTWCLPSPKGELLAAWECSAQMRGGQGPRVPGALHQPKSPPLAESPCFPSFPHFFLLLLSLCDYCYFCLQLTQLGGLVVYLLDCFLCLLKNIIQGLGI